MHNLQSNKKLYSLQSVTKTFIVLCQRGSLMQLRGQFDRMIANRFEKVSLGHDTINCSCMAGHNIRYKFVAKYRENSLKFQ